MEWLYRPTKRRRSSGGGLPVASPEYWWNGFAGVALDGSNNVTSWTDAESGNVAVPSPNPPPYDAPSGSIYVPNTVFAVNHQKLIASNNVPLTPDFRFMIDGSGDGCSFWGRMSFRLATASDNYICGLEEFGGSGWYINRRAGSTVLQVVHNPFGSSGFTTVSTGPTSNGTVYNVFVTTDPLTAPSPQLRIYLNSTTPVQSTTVTNYYASTVDLPPFGIGGTPGSGNQQIAEADFFQMALWNRVLTTEEIQSLIDWVPS